MPKYVIETHMPLEHVADLIDRARDAVGFDGTEYTITQAPVEPVDTDAAKTAVLECLKDFIHCGDYAHAWWNPDDRVLWLTLGDGDGDTEEGYSDFEVFKAKLLALELEPGTNLVTEVLIEAECNPDEEYWVEWGGFGRVITPYDTVTKEWRELIHASSSCLFPYDWKYTDDPVLKTAAEDLDAARVIVLKVVEDLRQIALDNDPARKK